MQSDVARLYQATSQLNTPPSPPIPPIPQPLPTMSKQVLPDAPVSKQNTEKLVELYFSDTPTSDQELNESGEILVKHPIAQL